MNKTSAGSRVALTVAVTVVLSFLMPNALAQTVDLQVVKTGDAPFYVSGDTVTYEIYVTNNGPDDANGVAVSDTFPAPVIVANLTDIVHTQTAGCILVSSQTTVTEIADVWNIPAGGQVHYTVTGQIESQSVSFTIESLLPDTTALLPLNDWAPIFIFHMDAPDAGSSTDIENVASADPPDGATDPDTNNNSDSAAATILAQGEERRLASLVFKFKFDPKAGDRSYDVFGGGPIPSDIYQIGVFVDGGKCDDKGTLNKDDYLVVGRSTGPFAGVPLVFDPDGFVFGSGQPSIDSDPDPLAFDLDLTEFEIDAWTVGDCPPFPYILAIRTTATWRNAITLAYEVTNALMVLPDGTVPTGQDGIPDTYTPDFTKGEKLDPETAYSSSFGVWDITSGPTTQTWQDGEFANAWAHPRTYYTPLAEYRRPRFDAIGTAFDLVGGEFLDLRRLFPLDQWTPVIGINLHGYHGPRGLSSGGIADPPGFITGPALKEVNVILTDIGADPNGPAGNGSFNPNQALETMRNDVDSTSASFNPDDSIRRDFGYSGLWIFHDTNGNGVFDQPVPLPGGGVSFAGGDYPMFPEDNNYLESPDDRLSGLPTWQYVPYPPGGGDPWWKIRLRLSYLGRRRDVAGDPPPPAGGGWLEATPDGDSSVYPTSHYNDFFVVVRPDGGYQDSSGLPGDGVGMTYGADFRAFIEPRRFNPNSAFPGALAGQEDGGIFVSSQLPSDSDIVEGNYESYAWQEDPRWGVSEPWWPQRTLNRTNAKPARGGAEIHDLVITYESNNLFARTSDVNYGSGMNVTGAYGVGEFVFDPTDPFYPNFSRWLDPYGLVATSFQDVHPVGVAAWRTFINGIPSADDQLFDAFQYPYETVPFLIPEHDLPPFGPRSAFLPVPPTATTLPDYATWPALLQPGEYPRESQWPLGNRTSRYLKQHIEPQGRATAMLGINLVGADDPVVNSITQIKLQQITVAFWGPDFDPNTDFLALDPNGTSTTSGVLLVEDTSGDGVFGGVLTTTDELSLDTPVQLTGLAWRTEPELVDLTGDGVPDDLSGDGVVTDVDKAWVLRLRPIDPWLLPVRDASGGYLPPASTTASGPQVVSEPADQPATKETKSAPVDPGKAYWAKVPVTITEAQETSTAKALKTAVTKAIGPSGHPGDDLFVVVRTTDQLRRFEQFRAVVPSTLPERMLETDRIAGIQLLPQTPISQSLYQKTQPDEGPVQTYYGPASPAYKPDQPWLSYDFGYDMLEANIGAKIVDLTGTGQTIAKNSGDVAVLGIDVSTNRSTAVGTVASGTSGTGGPATFTVSSAGWTGGAFTGYFLIDKNYQAFRITGNDSTKLFLQATADAAGTPASGVWRVVKDPSFLEQVIIELYDVDNDGGFNLLDDLLPLDIDPALSGIKLYRDNDNDPANINGVFDPADIPVPLDYRPFQIGQAGEPDTQVMMVFSTPGTDDIPQPIANQTRHRQWIPDTFGDTASDIAKGPDFFVVISTSDQIEVGDDFRVGLVSWGPNTPTEPDPDTFPPPPTSRVGEFDVFSEFPWGERSLGFISFFTDQPYYKVYPEVDNSGFDWVRSTANKNAVTGTITAVGGVVQGDDVAIIDVVPKQLAKNTPAGGVTLSITGQNFGSSPIVTLDGVTLTIVSATDTLIVATIPGGTVVDPDNNNVATLKVTNSTTGKFDTFNGFTITSGGGGTAPTITAVIPDQGRNTDFPVTVTGTNFDDPKVYFGGTLMPVNSWTPTSIIVGFPAGGLPSTGLMDVTVQNQTSGLFAVLPDGFTYINTPTGGGGTGGGFGVNGGLPSCFIATAAYGSPFAEKLDTFRNFRDTVLLKTAVGAAAVDLYYTLSPPIADQVAAHPALALLVRIVLTPVAWGLESPGLTAALLLVLAVGVAFRVRRKRQVVRD